MIESEVATMIRHPCRAATAATLCPECESEWIAGKALLRRFDPGLM